MNLRPLLLFLLLLGIISPTSRLRAAEDLRLGLIGLDTSHVIAFTRLINGSDEKPSNSGAKVIAGFRGGSPDIESSFRRVDGYTQQLREEFGVAIVPTIEELCRKVDAVLLTSVDGRPHLAQARPVILAGKRLFIDKPVAGSLRDAIEIYRLAKARGVPVFSSSAYRFYDSLVKVKNAPVGQVRSVISYGPAYREPHHPDLFWYGVHPTEALFTILGPGCETVVRTAATDTDVITGVWSGGRLGILHALSKGPAPHKIIVFGTESVAEQSGSGDYAPLVREILKFFRTGIAPVSPEETVELFAFMEAADESKRLGGRPVSIRDLIDRNRRRGSPADNAD